MLCFSGYASAPPSAALQQRRTPARTDTDTGRQPAGVTTLARGKTTGFARSDWSAAARSWLGAPPDLNVSAVLYEAVRRTTLKRLLVAPSSHQIRAKPGSPKWAW